MRTLEYGTTTHVPAFLTKLWKLVTDESCNELISWNFNGNSFIIKDEVRFSKELLPMYFKHNNMASFVRQLNMYGFRKLSCIDQGGMHSSKNEIEFYHQYFLKGQETLLELIKRKIPNSKSEEPRYKQQIVEELISSVRALKSKQEFTDTALRKLKRENKDLWNHVHYLNDRYTYQNRIIQQFVPYFMNMVNSSTSMAAVKRKSPPLMIDEGESTQNKIARLSPPYLVLEQDSNMSMPSSPSGNVSNRGPVIHDVTELESSKMFPGMSNEGVVDDSPCNLESSKQTTSFTQPGSMEALKIINQNFESRSRSSSLGSSIDVKPPKRHLGGYSSTSPTIIIDETTSDVPLMKMEAPDTMYGLIQQVTGMDEATMMSRPPPPPTTFRQEATGFMPQIKEDMPEMNWMMNQPPPPAPEPFAPEPSIENWLGQIIKSDNLIPGCSLPQANTALPGSLNFGYVNYPQKRV